MVEFLTKSSYEIARRLEARGEDSYSWFVLLKPAGVADVALHEFAEELNAFLGKKPRIIDIAGMLVDDLSARLRIPADDPVILVGFDDRTPEFWSVMDVNRSGLERPGPVVFWISAAGVSNLCSHAPNVRSLIGGSIFLIGAAGGDMAAEEKTARLKELSSFYSLSNEEVIQKAEERKLPPEPEFIEWLLLLGRGDLV
jgi:hypothetical protein